MPTTSPVLTFLAGLGLLLTLAGCAGALTPAPGTSPGASAAPSDQGDPPDADGADPSAEPERTDPGSGSIAELPDGNFAGLGQLRAALDAIGVECSDWTQDDDVSGSLESGWCSDQWGLAIFPGPAERNALLKLSNDSQEPQPFLVDGNWSITRGYEDPADLEFVRGEFGGEIWYPGEPYPD